MSRKFRTEAKEQRSYLVAQNDPALLPWLCGASHEAGDFLKHLADAGLRADCENYAILRPVLFRLRLKYPQYYTDELERMMRDGYDPDAPENNAVSLLEMF